MNRVRERAQAAPQTIPSEERRRSQRVVIRVNVTLHYMLQNHLSSIPASTVAVNDHGAMLVCARALPAGTRLELQNNHTRQRLRCRVSRSPRETPEGFQIPIEFEALAKGFWHISFPPPDWKPVDD